MKTLKFIIPAMIIAIVALTSTSCKKKRGTCYCTFYSGDKSHFDLGDLPRQEQKDSCNVISNNASNYAGSCKLK